MKLTPDVIARTALRLLNDVGLDGLTMRALAKELGVQAPTLYWHVKNKQELLDAMAELMSAETSADIEAPRHGVTWQEWVTDAAWRMRRTMLRYRDGARVSAGANTTGPGVRRMIELTLRTLTDAGFPVADAARAFPTVLHYTVGFVIEEQARTGAAYVGDNPYEKGLGLDLEKHPLTASVAKELYDVDSDANFEFGLRVILTGMRVEVLGP